MPDKILFEFSEQGLEAISYRLASIGSELTKTKSKGKEVFTPMEGSLASLQQKLKQLQIEIERTSFIGSVKQQELIEEYKKTKIEIDKVKDAMRTTATLTESIAAGMKQAFDQLKLKINQDTQALNNLKSAIKSAGNINTKEIADMKNQYNNLKISIDKDTSALGQLEKKMLTQGQITQSVTTGMKSAFADLKKNAIDGLKSAFTGLGVAMVAVFALNKIKNFIAEGIKGAMEARTNEALLLKALNNRKDIQEELIALAEEWASKTLFEDDDILIAEKLFAVLLKNKGVIKDLIPVTLNYASLMGVDLETTTKKLASVVSGASSKLKGFKIDFKDCNTEAERTAKLMEVVGKAMEGQAEIEASKQPYKMLAKNLGEAGEKFGELILQMDDAGGTGENLNSIVVKLNLALADAGKQGTTANLVWKGIINSFKELNIFSSVARSVTGLGTIFDGFKTNWIDGIKHMGKVIADVFSFGYLSGITNWVNGFGISWEKAGLKIERAALQAEIFFKTSSERKEYINGRLKDIDTELNAIRASEKKKQEIVKQTEIGVSVIHDLTNDKWITGDEATIKKIQIANKKYLDNKEKAEKEAAEKAAILKQKEEQENKERLYKQLDAIEEFYADEDALAKKQYDEKIETAKDLAKEEKEIRKKSKEEANAAYEKDKDNKAKAIEDTKQATVGAARETANAIVEIMSKRQRWETEQELSELEKRRSHELENKNMTEAQIDAINLKYDKEEEKLKKKQFEKDKRLAILKAFINAASAFVAAWIEPTPLAVAKIIAIASTLAAQVAVIATQKFAKGKIDIRGGQEGKDSIPALIMPHESVVNVKGTMKYKSVLQAINDDRLDEHLSKVYLPKLIAKKKGGDFAENLMNVLNNSQVFDDYRLYKEAKRGNKLSEVNTERLIKAIEKQNKKRLWSD